MTPLQSGDQVLTLSATAKIYLEGRGEKSSQPTTLNKDIFVKVDRWYNAQQFFANNWQWLWAEVVVPAAGLLWRLRKGKSEPANRADEFLYSSLRYSANFPVESLTCVKIDDQATSTFALPQETAMKFVLMRALNAVLLLLITTAIVGAQSYKPAIEYQSLMTMRFYEANGGFLVEDLQLVFPPSSTGDAKFVVTDSAGQVVDTVPLRYERMEFPAFGRFRPASGNPGSVRIGKSGSFVISVILDGQTITSMPFTLKEETSADPFNPGKRFVRDGSWRDLAYFSVVPDDPNEQVKFNWWLSTRELPPGMKEPKVTIHLLVNGKEIAASRGPVVPTTVDWYFYQQKEMIMPTLPRNRWLTLADMTKVNGDVTLVVKANGQPVKSYKAQVTGGQLQRLPQNALNTEPHSSFVSPRFIDTSSGSNSNYKMFEMYWVRKQ